MKTLSIVKASADIEDKEREEFSHSASEVSQLISSLRGKDSTEPFAIRTDVDFDFATDLLLHAQGKVKEIKTRSESVTKPLYQALEAFRDIYRPALKGYTSVVDYLKPLVGAYTLQKEQAQAQAMREIAAAASNNDFDAAMEISSKVETVPKKAGLSVSIGYTYEVTDWSKVPEEYRVQEINTKAIGSYIKTFSGKPKDLPGIRFVEAASVRKTGR